MKKTSQHENENYIKFRNFTLFTEKVALPFLEKKSRKLIRDSSSGLLNVS